MGTLVDYDVTSDNGGSGIMTSHHGNTALIGCFTKAISLIGGSWMRLQKVFANELFKICLWANVTPTSGVVLSPYVRSGVAIWRRLTSSATCASGGR